MTPGWNMFVGQRNTFAQKQSLGLFTGTKLFRQDVKSALRPAYSY